MATKICNFFEFFKIFFSTGPFFLNSAHIKDSNITAPIKIDECGYNHIFLHFLLDEYDVRNQRAGQAASLPRKVGLKFRAYR